jgi:hypothetical protein
MSSMTSAFACSNSACALASAFLRVTSCSLIFSTDSAGHDDERRPSDDPAEDAVGCVSEKLPRDVDCLPLGAVDHGTGRRLLEVISEYGGKAEEPGSSSSSKVLRVMITPGIGSETLLWLDIFRQGLRGSRQAGEYLQADSGVHLLTNSCSSA